MQSNAPTNNGANHQHATAQPQWVTLGLYILINKKTHTLLDLCGGNMSSGSPVEGWARNSDENFDHQLWVITRNQADGNYRIMSYRAGTYLDLVSGKHDPRSQVVAFNYVGNGQSRFNQEWRISGEFGDRYFTISCVASHTFLEINNGKTANGTPATCSPRAHKGDHHREDHHHEDHYHEDYHHDEDYYYEDHHPEDHQLWQLERVSRTYQEIEALIMSWKPGLLGHLVQPCANDVRYFVLPNRLRDAVYHGTNLRHQPVRKGTFDYGDFVIKAKDAVKTWARGRFRIDGYSVIFGIIYGNASIGPKAYNWYLSPNLQSLMFFDPQTGNEYTAAALDASGFKPTFAIL